MQREIARRAGGTQQHATHRERSVELRDLQRYDDGPDFAVRLVNREPQLVASGRQFEPVNEAQAGLLDARARL